jgi:hypothetical protein
VKVGHVALESRFARQPPLEAQGLCSGIRDAANLA